MESMDTGDMSKMADQKQTQPDEGQVKKVVDPVCHMPVDPKLAEKSVYKGKTYYFCSKGDKEKFEQSPEKYLKQEKTNH
jgi:YHS domain-containing protein